MWSQQPETPPILTPTIQPFFVLRDLRSFSRILRNAKSYFQGVCWSAIQGMYPDLGISLQYFVQINIHIDVKKIAFAAHTTPRFIVEIREAPLKFMSWAFGHCPFSFCTPPPHSNGHSGALFSGPIWATLSNHHKCPKLSWQGFRPPQSQANAHLILANSSLKKCPKPSGQGLRPPPLRAMPKCPRVNLSGASLSH